MWTAETRRTYDRKGLRYPTDGTDAEWELARPFIDVAQRGPGRQRRVDLREVLNAVFYVLGTGCQWRALPKDLPPCKGRRKYVPTGRSNRVPTGAAMNRRPDALDSFFIERSCAVLNFSRTA